MKAKPPAEKKEPRAPRMEWHQSVYSETALKMMEQATGQRFAQLPARITPPAAALAEKD